jgi:UDP-3-O-[3-hydroxymyristoyl] glucosamine N-acyltransferase
VLMRRVVEAEYSLTGVWKSVRVEASTRIGEAGYGYHKLWNLELWTAVFETGNVSL